MEKKFGWLSEEQKKMAISIYQDAEIHDGFWYKLDEKGNVFDRSIISDTKCNYPECTCPFDAPEDKNWCAMGYLKK